MVQVRLGDRHHQARIRVLEILGGGMGVVYNLVDIGTFGRPNGSFVLPSPGGRILNNSGAAVGGAHTSTSDPSSCINFDCYLSYGFKWQDGIAKRLGALPGF